MVSENRNRNLGKWLLGFFIAAILIAIGIFFIYAFYFGAFGVSKTQEIWGQFGDFIGGILNPIFALLAFGALLFTINLQSQELNDTRIELKKSADALDLQNFENTFFKLVQVLNKKLNSLFHNETTRGDKALSHQRAILSQNHRRILESDNATNPEIVARSELLGFLESYPQIGSYLRTIEVIVKIVDNAQQFSDEQKYFYVRILKSQLTDTDAHLIWYYGVSNINFRKLIEKYSLLDLLPIDKLNSSLQLRGERFEAYVRIYSREAYGNQDIDRYLTRI